MAYYCSPRQMGAEGSMLSGQGVLASFVIELDLGARISDSDNMLSSPRRVDAERSMGNTPEQHSRAVEEEWTFPTFPSTLSSQESCSLVIPESEAGDDTDDVTLKPGDSHDEHFALMNRLCLSLKLRRLIFQGRALCAYGRMAIVDEVMKEVILMDSRDFEEFKATFPNTFSPVIWDTIQRHRRIIKISGICTYTPPKCPK